jgi:hypothetical protein
MTSSFSCEIPILLVEKGEVKAIWLKIFQSTVRGEDIGKCDKNYDD